MSFSTPGMISETKTHPYSRPNMTFQTHLPNPMMLSDPTYKSKEMPNFQAFQASQMRNPWAHQQLNNAQFPALQSWHVSLMTKETSWGLSVLSPEVESRNARCV
jgi:hypothetical protein